MGTSEAGGLLSSELRAADFRDARLTARLGRLSDALVASPALSLPKALDAAELEAAYRFFRNESVTPERILAPHVEASARRASAEPEAIAVHDTTIMTFPGEGDRGLGPIHTKQPGFLAHFTIGVRSDAGRRPLGVLGLSTIIRAPSRKTEMPNESERWWRQVDEVDARVGARAKLVHVMDREADDFALFARMVDGGFRFVVRLAHNRLLSAHDANAPRKLFEALEAAPVIATREVPIARRGKPVAPSGAKIHPPRSGRLAKLAVAATKVILKRPNLRSHRSKSMPLNVAVNVVHVREVDTPDGASPVTWMLVTSDAVETADDILAVVDRYRARWTIEEYFKALKTGCAYEKRQLESAHSLLNALALFAPIAWQVMLLRSEARREPDSRAAEEFDPITLRVLKHFSRIRLPPDPSLREAMLAIAALGGHLKHNGEPGWQTLWAGHTKLQTLVEGWRAAAAEVDHI
jgi:hypothetical protein